VPYFRQVIRVEEIVEDFFYRGADLDAFWNLAMEFLLYQMS
jgi:hypothetical protein